MRNFFTPFFICIFILALLICGIIFWTSKITANKEAVKDVVRELYSVERFGPLKVGGDLPIGPGDTTFAPYMVVPRSRFYINVISTDPNEYWCVQDYCGVEGGYVQKVGGWMEAQNIKTDPELGSIFENLSKKSSIVIVADHNAKIISLYPDKTKNDVISILKQLDYL
jgi:hypothetical protein